LYSGTRVFRAILIIEWLNRDRVDEARHELFRLLSEKEMKNIKLLVLANKIDLSHALSREKVTPLSLLFEC